MTHERNMTSSEIHSVILGLLRSGDKSKLALLKCILNEGKISRSQLLLSVAKFHYQGLPSAWLEKSLDSLIDSGLVHQDKDRDCSLAVASLIGKIFYEEEKEISRILDEKWGAGDLYYIEPLWQYIAEKIFVLGKEVEVELLLKELEKDAEDHLGPFRGYTSIATAKYTVIPRELSYMQEFGLVQRRGKLLMLPNFVLEFIFQRRLSVLEQVQATITRLRSEKEDMNRKLLHLEELYDLQKLENATIRQLSYQQMIGKDELTNHLANAFEQLQHMNCYDTISSCGRAAEILVAAIFVHLKGEENARRTPQMGNQLAKLWKTEVPGQITTPLELVLSLLSSVKWLRDKKGAHPSDLTGFEPPTIDEARQAVATILFATKYAIDFGFLSG